MKNVLLSFEQIKFSTCEKNLLSLVKLFLEIFYQACVNDHKQEFLIATTCLSRGLKGGCCSHFKTFQKVYVVKNIVNCIKDKNLKAF